MTGNPGLTTSSSNGGISENIFIGNVRRFYTRGSTEPFKEYGLLYAFKNIFFSLDTCSLYDLFYGVTDRLNRAQPLMVDHLKNIVF